MPPKKNRLTTKDFNGDLKGIILKGKYFDIRKISFNKLKLGCILSKKSFKKNILRHKIRRVFYNALFFITTTKNIKGIFIVYPKKEATLLPHTKLLKELEKAVD